MSNNLTHAVRALIARVEVLEERVDTLTERPDEQDEQFDDVVVEQMPVHILDGAAKPEYQSETTPEASPEFPDPEIYLDAFEDTEEKFRK